MQVRLGRFYEFHRERVISRPGQPIVTVAGVEVGPEISREEAVRQLKGGKDVYSWGKEDAYKLAAQLYHGPPVEHAPHDQVYFCHYHPGGEHPEFDDDRPGRPKAAAGPGHVFFGERGRGL